jgi:thiosulfate dehydrogenase [quinone] large subunit
MDNDKKVVYASVALRLLLGWWMFFDGFLNLLNPNFTAAKFLLGAKTFPGFYAWFASPANLAWIDPFNLAAIILIGLAMFFGVFVRPAAWAGVAMMVIYYFPHYVLPVVPNGYIVDSHVFYAAIFIFVAVSPAARQFSLGNLLREKTALGKVPFIGKYL